MIRGLIIGGSVGAIIGLLHGWSVYVRRGGHAPVPAAGGPAARRAHPAYYALWTFVLWVLFGTYVLYLWAISLVVYAAYRVVKALANLVSSR